MTRLAHTWRARGREQRMAAIAGLGLFLSMLLPWYSKTFVFLQRGSAKTGQQSLSAFQAFSFVEAAVLVVSAGVLAMLFARAERRTFRLPGGDGLIVTIAGGSAPGGGEPTAPAERASGERGGADLGGHAHGEGATTVLPARERQQAT